MNVLEILKKYGPLTRTELESYLDRSGYQEFIYLLTKGKIVYKNKLFSIPEKKLKYRNKKTTFDGHKFDSIKEKNRYFDLSLLERIEEIHDLELQPKFEIIPAVVWNGKKLRAKYYIADFSYTENGQKIIEDVKGVRTPAYILKRQLFLIRYPGYRFIET